MKSVVITALLSAGLLTGCSVPAPKVVNTICRQEGGYIAGTEYVELHYAWVVYDNGSTEPLLMDGRKVDCSP